MNLKVLSLSGLGVLGVGAAGAVGIAASSGWGEKESEEIATPAPTPTISQKLSNSGYTYNPPKLSDHGRLVQDCTENLLNKKGLDNSKLYGCGVAKLDLWDSGDQFGNEKVNYLKFASEIFIRQENEGWRINTRIDNYSSDALFYQHLLTHYKKGNGEDLEIKESFLIKVGNRQPIKDISFSGQKTANPAIGAGTLNLNIKLPGETNHWYHRNNYLFMSYLTGAPALIKDNKETKTWSGIWIDKSSSDKQWIFQDMEVFIGSKSYSQVFCKEKSCSAGDNNILYNLKHSQGGPSAPSVWWEAENKLVHPAGNQGPEISTNTDEPRKSILKFIEGSQGEWVNANNFCKSGSELETKISDEELEKLKLYCSKSKN